jgi:hypothetical protein
MIILQDTSEQKPWDFSFYGYESKKYNLDTGDYTTEELKDIYRVERKASTGELAINIGSKGRQFYAEMERMLDYKHRYIICEFPFQDLLTFPLNSGIPKSKIPHLKISKNFLISSLERIENKYNIEIIYAINRDAARDKFITITTGITH